MKSQRLDPTHQSRQFEVPLIIGAPNNWLQFHMLGLARAATAATNSAELAGLATCIW
jgi:hypothetical protein